MATGERRTHVILNPASSAGRTGRRRAEILAAVERHLGGGFSLLVTTRPGEAADSARDASLRGAGLIIAVGGDGTVQEVVNGLIDAGLPPDRLPQLGLVSAGTGHGFAQSLGLPADLEAQCAGIALGPCRRIDIGRAVYTNAAGRRVERCFVNECQAGIGGHVVQKVQAGHKRLGGFLAFGLATLTSALTCPNRAMRFSVDDGPEEAGAFLGIVAANGSAMAGGMRLAPRAAVDDGRLDILFMHGQGLAERLRNFPKIYSGKHLGSPKFSCLRAKSLSLTSEGPVPFEADGELFGHLPCLIEILPSALELRAGGPATG
ncbi:MAG TPA: diacylglycerol kinase family protein [Terriglobales bacterium]|nr:diacylglycerol kinase family protein [Terriglobales bacterium]